MDVYRPPTKNTKEYRLGLLILRSHFGTDKERYTALKNENDLEVLKKASETIKQDAQRLSFSRTRQLNYATMIDWKIKRLSNLQVEHVK